MLTFRNYNIADWFSFYRIAASPFLLGLIWLEEQFIFACLLALSYSTDAIDGYLARKLKIVSPRGSQLDSFGDQITLVIGLVGLFFFEKAFILENLTIIIVVFIPYIVQMLIAYIKYGKATAFHTYLAKTSAVMQSIFILFALFYEPNYTLFYIMIVIGLLETFEEIVLIFMHKHWVSDINGIFWVYKDRYRSRRKENNNTHD